MASLDFKKKKINLVERPEWADYDTPGNDYVIFQNAAETYSELDPDALDARIDDVLSAGARKRVRTTEEETDAIYEAMRKGTLESFDTLIRDWLSYTWERAYIPTDEDIEGALDDATEYIAARWTSYLGDYEGLWEIAETIPGTPAQFIKNLIDSSSWYFRKPGWYDRYVILDPGQSSLVDRLLHQPIQAQKTGVLEWTPALEIPKEEIARELDAFYRDIEETVIGQMFRALKTTMSGTDYGNRTDFNKMWKEILETDPKRIKEAKKELKQFLRELEVGNG